MTGLELLEKNPLSKKIIKDWFIEKMLESIVESDNLPDDFKQMIITSGVEDVTIINIIDNNVRTLFDLFDEHDVIVIINYHENASFSFVVNDYVDEVSYEKRKECEKHAMVIAFDLLEVNLKLTER